MARSSAAIAAVLLLLGLGVAGCSQQEKPSALPGGDVTATQSTPTQKADGEEAFLEYAKCLREQGVDIADPRESGGINMPEGDPALLKKAEEACAAKLPAGGQEAGGNTDPNAGLDAALKLAACLRAKGHDFPDPKVDSSGKMQFAPPESNAWQADAPECLKQIGAGQ